MAKSISSALAAHWASEATTLATCWRVTRKDGREFFFTDHDRDLAFDGTVDIDCSAGNTTVSAADYRENFLLRLTGTPPADFTFSLLDGKRVVAMHHRPPASAAG